MEDKIIQTHITILLYLMLIVYLKSFTINLGDMPKKLFTYIKVYYGFLIVITIVAFFRRLFLLFYLYITNTINKLFNYILLKDNKNEINYIKGYANKQYVQDIFFQNNLESEIINKYLNQNQIDFYRYFLFCDNLVNYDKNTNLCLTNKNDVVQNESGQNEINHDNSIYMKSGYANKSNGGDDDDGNGNDNGDDEENEIFFSSCDTLYDVANSQADRSNLLNRINTKFSRKLFNFFFRKNNSLLKKTLNKGKEKEKEKEKENENENEKENENETQESKNGISTFGEIKSNSDSKMSNEMDGEEKSNKGKYGSNHIKSYKLNKERYFQKHLIKFKHLKFITFMLDLLNNYKKYIMIDKLIKQLSRPATTTNGNSSGGDGGNSSGNAEDNSLCKEKQNDGLVVEKINNFEKTYEELNCMRKNNSNKLESYNLFSSNIFGNIFNTDSEKKSQKSKKYFVQNLDFQNDNKENVNMEKEIKKNNVMLKSILKKNTSNLKNKNKKHIRFNPKVQTLLFEKYSDEEEYIYNMNSGKKGLYKITDEYNIKNSDIFSYYNMRNNLNSIFTDIINSVYVYKDKMSRKI
ncbi:uncharacterized protein PY17X_0710700 [Plasmodium yoelii]|uniref:Uncharacterized protein n=2 Tax=Plasmodium yoelii TaxID=5861 RepID=A0AAE9WSJ5_PLAYO|nr:uncharacterized protein PY17X_0710700 [Plasmodium yoelii]EAA18299.1 synthetic antigen of P.falciparum [Plasmodium yoelii yoelii]WBY56327.1 hypothetical protein Py17XNL_000704196 [Plasmodium yoelii yoelii]CDU17227.1 conserved Plasmodium protein, unknown function [Plasmodium yoelii]VTZ76393.1 conserved Plasmodium protein, unknown function [Plasmodium yoelii]|eukprot:XP_726734.1 uncharacterized protein PY17X_0710700 [Plasmodium yoelii]